VFYWGKTLGYLWSLKLKKELSGNVACQSWPIIAKFWTFKQLYWLNQVTTILAVPAKNLFKTCLFIEKMKKRNSDRLQKPVFGPGLKTFQYILKSCIFGLALIFSPIGTWFFFLQTNTKKPVYLSKK
jgi:hypothetical protein